MSSTPHRSAKAANATPGGQEGHAGVPRWQGVQFGDHNVQYNTFNYVQKQIIEAPAPRVTWPVRVGDVPQRPPAFQPRRDLLVALHRPKPEGSVVRSVIGMRGVGKTQVAAAYARSRMADGWRLVAWINAQDMTNALNGLGETAARLGIAEPGASLENDAAAVRSWLEADGAECLVVFDNAADLDGLRQYLPAAGSAEVLITSNLQAAANLGHAVPVDVFTEEEALAFLADRTGIAGAGTGPELAEVLGCLPLALAQAAAVIARQRLSYPAYFERLRNLPASEYLQPVHAIPIRWRRGGRAVSLESAGARDSSSGPGAVLDLIAVLSTARVSRALLYAAGDSGAPGTVSQAGLVPIAVDDALAQLADASLLTFSLDGSGGARTGS